MYSATLTEYKYGSKNNSEIFEFKTKKELDNKFQEVKEWLETDKGCDQKWFLIAEFSDGRNLSGEINL